MSRPKTALRKLAQAIRELSYVDTEDLAFALRNIAVSREENVGIAFDVDDHMHWMEMIQGWASGKLDE
ncbi:hypothetical protein [Bradyrhizobium sp. SZCCHNRI2010]|uniref:hypothetical protein n=1 Tax=Bradyrhizobium sp. SZCCHNRI2010 TaxID=3057283 RepID=UPI0028E1E67E|nr:hypothetical protein [Bradyrhizobium sp. SZCCHNRI2010]